MGTTTTQNIILLAGLLVQIVTLIFLVRYVRATKGIENAANEQTNGTQNLVKAANEQSEGLSKPAVAATQIQRAQAEAFILHVKNIGNGPALAVQWKLEVNPDAADQPICEGHVAYMEAGQPREIWARVQRAPKELMGYRVRCTYRSLADSRYVATSILDRHGHPEDFGFVGGYTSGT